MNPRTGPKLKLLIDRKSQRVLFAEAKKEFVDFLANLLSVPISTVNRLLKARSLGNTLHKSVKNLTINQAASEPNFNDIQALKLKPTSTSDPEKMYVCGYEEDVFFCLFGSLDQYNVTARDHRVPIASYHPHRCPFCYKLMTKEVTFIGVPIPPVKNGDRASAAAAADNNPEHLSRKYNNYQEHFIPEGFYMIMDDLKVKPMSTISALFMLNSLNVKEIGDLEEKMVSFGINEGFKLLASLVDSKTVLTDIFLEKQSSKTLAADTEENSIMA